MASQPWRMAASTPILTGASPMTLAPASGCCCQEQFEARHRNDARRDALRCASSLRASTAIATSEPVAKIETSARSSAAGDLIGARARSGSRRRAELRSCGRFCRVSASTLGPISGLERELPALGGLDRVAGAEHDQIRNGAQRREMLDRLMRRAVFAEADGVVRHHMDDALAHQRGEPDRRPAIVGEHQERAGVGNDAAVQRHAVHGGRHAVLAHAVMDEAAGDNRRPTSPSSPLVRVLLEPVRSAEPPIISGSAGIRLSSANSEAVRVAMSLGCRRELFLHCAHRGRERLLRQIAAACGARIRARLPPSSSRSRACPVGMCAPLNARRRCATRQDVGGNLERRVCPAELLARACNFFGAERRAVRFFRCRPWSARRSRSWCCRRSATGLSDVCAFSIAAAIAAGSWPSMRERGPAGGLEALHLIDASRQATAGRRWKCRCRRTAR